MTSKAAIERGYCKAKNIVLRWEKRYPNRQDIIDFLVRDDMLSTRSQGKLQFYREYLQRPKQKIQLPGIGPLPLPLQKELETL